MADKEKSRKSLVLVTKARAPLSKAQQAFNRLVKKIEKLHAKIREENKLLNETMALYEKHIRPLQERALANRKELVTSLAPFLEPGKLKKDELKILREFLANQLVDIARQEGSLSPDLQTVFETIHAVSFQQAMRQEMESAHSQMKEMFESFGVDIDLGDLPPDMTQEEMQAQSARIAARLRAESQRLDEEPQPGARPGKKGSTTKEDQARQKEEARKTSLSKIYRDLARVLHPDLEPDESIRPQKVQLMSRLTAAYRENDLHTLLSLELEWLQRHDGDLREMTDEKLRIYNTVLQEQARDLEDELQELPLQPQFSPIVKQVGPMEYQVLVDTEYEIDRMSMMVSSMEQSLQRLRKGMGLSEIRMIVRDYREDRRPRRR